MQMSFLVLVLNLNRLGRGIAFWRNNMQFITHLPTHRPEQVKRPFVFPKVHSQRNGKSDCTGRGGMYVWPYFCIAEFLCFSVFSTLSCNGTLLMDPNLAERYWTAFVVETSDLALVKEIFSVVYCKPVLSSHFQMRLLRS